MKKRNDLSRILIMFWFEKQLFHVSILIIVETIAGNVYDVFVNNPKNGINFEIVMVWSWTCNMVEFTIYVHDVSNAKCGFGLSKGMVKNILNYGGLAK
jgi:hypothetical protein